MRIEYFDDLQNKIDYLSNIRSTLKIGDCKYEYHLRKLTINIHYLQVEQDKLLKSVNKRCNSCHHKNGR